MNIKPLADRVLILPAPAEEKTIGGIIIPDTAKERPLKGEVVAVGHGTKDEEMVLKVGDTVLYGKYAGTCLLYTSLPGASVPCTTLPFQSVVQSGHDYPYCSVHIPAYPKFLRDG